MTFFDFHTHSTRSDGLESLEDLTAAARAAGLSAFAVTDHNRLLDVRCAARLGREHQIVVVPGCEFSASIVLSGEHDAIEIHVIGLWLWETAAVRRVLRQNHPNRKPYVMAYLRQLDCLGIDLSPAGDHDPEQAYRQLIKENPDSTHLGRMAIAQRMVQLGLAGSTHEAFTEWLGREPGDQKRIQLRAEDFLTYAALDEVISAIHSCPGALAVLCHPFYHIPEGRVEDLVQQFAQLGGDAMETHYGSGHNTYSAEQQAYLLELAARYKLLPSAGSDRHGPESPFRYGTPEALRRLLQRHCALPSGRQK